MAQSPREKLEAMLEREVDRRFELEIVDRLRGKRLSPLAQKTEAAGDDETVTDEEKMSDEDLALLQELDAQSGDNNAGA